MSIIGKFLKIAGKDPNGNAKGVAVTENGEVKVQADELEGLLEEIRDKDFATDTKLELVRALLESINSKDYSTEVTLQAVLTELANLSDGTKAMKVQQSGSIIEIDQISGGTITINAGATATIIEDYDFSDGKVNKFKMNWYGNMDDDNNCEMRVYFTNNKGDYGTASGYVFADNVSMIKCVGTTVYTVYTDDVYVRGKYMKIEVINNDDSDRFYRRFTIINNIPKGDK